MGQQQGTWETAEGPKGAWRWHPRDGLGLGLSLRDVSAVALSRFLQRRNWGLSVCQWLALLGREGPPGRAMAGLRAQLRPSCAHTARALTHCQPGQGCSEMSPEHRAQHTGTGTRAGGLHTRALPCAQPSPCRPEALRGCSQQGTSTGVCRHWHTLGHSHTATHMIVGEHMGQRPEEGMALRRCWGAPSQSRFWQHQAGHKVR